MSVTEAEIIQHVVEDYAETLTAAIVAVERLEKLVKIVNACVVYGSSEMPEFPPLNPLTNGVRTVERRIKDLQNTVDHRVQFSKNKQPEL